MATAPDQTVQTTMHALKPVQTENLPVVTMGFATLQSFELMQRAAKLLSAASLVPKEYQGNLPNCVIALNMATRIGADPLLVMQNLYVVHGRPGWSAQFMIACFNQCGRFSSIRYRWGGTQGQDDWSCQAYATELSTGEEIVGPVISIGLAKKEGWYQKSGSKWQSIPQLMLMYRAAAWLVRTHAPEISMGLQTAEEVHDVYDAQRGADGHYEVTLGDLRPAAEPAATKTATAETVTETEAAAEETVDTETGEVIEGDAATALLAIKALEKCRKPETLRKTYSDIEDQFVDANRDVPFEVKAKFDELLEALVEREAQL